MPKGAKVTRVGYINKLASVISNSLDNVAYRRPRNTYTTKLLITATKLLDKYTDSSVLVEECYQMSRRIKTRTHLNTKLCVNYFNLVADVLWYLDVCSRHKSYSTARHLVYEITCTNWEKINRDSYSVKQASSKDLVHALCSDIEYFSDRWSLNRLFRSVYAFGDILVHDNIDVYDLCFNTRFHKLVV